MNDISSEIVYLLDRAPGVCMLIGNMSRRVLASCLLCPSLPQKLALKKMSGYARQQISSMLFAAVSFFVGCTQSATIVDQSEWPSPMADLLARYPGIVSAISTCKLDAFVNAKFVWRIVGQAEEIQRLIDESKLKLSTPAHVKFKELQQSVPDRWSLPHTKDTVVYASDGYGDRHQEGTDLILLVWDPGADKAYVLYEWIF